MYGWKNFVCQRKGEDLYYISTLFQLICKISVFFFFLFRRKHRKFVLVITCLMRKICDKFIEATFDISIQRTWLIYPKVHEYIKNVLITRN